MKNKKAWMRVVEAFLASLIIIGAVVVIMNKQSQSSDPEDDIYEKERQILEIISQDQDLRRIVIEWNDENPAGENKLKDLIGELMPPSWNFDICVIEIEEICSPKSPLPIDKNVYVAEIIITSVIDDYNPKKLKLFVWIE